jgi:ribosome recycling factor
LGLNPSDDGRLVRVPIPAPNEERRKDLVKQVGIKAEDARIVLRNIRQEAFKDIKKRKDAKEMSEDDAKRFEKEVDTAVGAANDKIEELLKIKEKDILTI